MNLHKWKLYDSNKHCRTYYLQRSLIGYRCAISNFCNKIKSSAFCPFYPSRRLCVCSFLRFLFFRLQSTSSTQQRAVSSYLVDFLSLGMLLSTFVLSYVPAVFSRSLSEFHELSLPSSMHRPAIVVLFPSCSTRRIARFKFEPASLFVRFRHERSRYDLVSSFSFGKGTGKSSVQVFCAHSSEMLDIYFLR